MEDFEFEEIPAFPPEGAGGGGGREWEKAENWASGSAADKPTATAAARTARHRDIFVLKEIIRIWND